MRGLLRAPEKVKKIWILSFELEGYAEVGGLARAVARHLRGLRSMGYEVTAFLPSHGRHLSNEHRTALGMKPLQDFRACGLRVGLDGASRRYCVGAEELYLHGARAVVFKGLDPETGPFLDRWGVYEELPEKACLFARALAHWAFFSEEAPDLIHSNDWASGLAGASLKIFYESRGLSIPFLHMIHLISSPAFPWHYASERWCGIPERGSLVWIPHRHVKRNTRELWDSVRGDVDAFALEQADAVASVSWSYLEEILSRYGHHLRHKACVAHNSTDWRLEDGERASLDLLGTSSRREARERIPRLLERIGIPSSGRIEGKRLLVSAAGRATWQKGFDTLLRALDILGEDFGAVLMLVPVGDSGYEEALHRMAVERWGKVSILWGSVEQRVRKAVIYASNVFAMPSRYEPLGIAALEAQALGTPVAATRVGGIPEIVIDYRTSEKGTGLLASPDNPWELAQALASLAWASEASDRGDAGLLSRAGFDEVRKVLEKDLHVVRRNPAELVDRMFREDATARELVSCYEKARQAAYYRAVASSAP